MEDRDSPSLPEVAALVNSVLMVRMSPSPVTMRKPWR